MKVWMLETSSHLRTYLAWCICLEKQLVFHFKWAIKPHQQSFFFCGRKVIEVQTALRSWSGTSWAWSWSVRPPSGQGLVLLSSASRVGDFGWWKHVGFRCWHSSMMESCEGVRLVSMILFGSRTLFGEPVASVFVKVIDRSIWKRPMLGQVGTFSSYLSQPLSCHRHAYEWWDLVRMVQRCLWNSRSRSSHEFYNSFTALMKILMVQLADTTP